MNHDAPTCRWLYGPSTARAPESAAGTQVSARYPDCSGGYMIILAGRTAFAGKKRLLRVQSSGPAALSPRAWHRARARRRHDDDATPPVTTSRIPLLPCVGCRVRVPPTVGALPRAARRPLRQSPLHAQRSPAAPRAVARWRVRGRRPNLPGVLSRVGAAGEATREGQRAAGDGDAEGARATAAASRGSGRTAWRHGRRDYRHGLRTRDAAASGTPTAGTRRRPGAAPRPRCLLLESHASVSQEGGRPVYACMRCRPLKRGASTARLLSRQGCLRGAASPSSSRVSLQVETLLEAAAASPSAGGTVRSCCSQAARRLPWPWTGMPPTPCPQHGNAPVLPRGMQRRTPKFRRNTGIHAPCPRCALHHLQRSTATKSSAVVLGRPGLAGAGLLVRLESMGGRQMGAASRVLARHPDAATAVPNPGHVAAVAGPSCACGLRKPCSTWACVPSRAGRRVPVGRCHVSATMTGRGQGCRFVPGLSPRYCWARHEHDRGRGRGRRRGAWWLEPMRLRCDAAAMAGRPPWAGRPLPHRGEPRGGRRGGDGCWWRRRWRRWWW